MPLAISPIGREVEITHCHADGTVKRYLGNLGILSGEKITPVADSLGNLIVSVRDSRLALNKGLAMKIYVR